VSRRCASTPDINYLSLQDTDNLAKAYALTKYGLPESLRLKFVNFTEKQLIIGPWVVGHESHQLRDYIIGPTVKQLLAGRNLKLQAHLPSHHCRFTPYPVVGYEWGGKLGSRTSSQRAAKKVEIVIMAPSSRNVTTLHRPPAASPPSPPRSCILHHGSGKCMDHPRFIKDHPFNP
jgi:hypothetical protein